MNMLIYVYIIIEQFSFSYTYSITNKSIYSLHQVLHRHVEVCLLSIANVIIVKGKL